MVETCLLFLKRKTYYGTKKSTNFDVVIFSLFAFWSQMLFSVSMCDHFWFEKHGIDHIQLYATRYVLCLTTYIAYMQIASVDQI